MQYVQVFKNTLGRILLVVTLLVGIFCFGSFVIKPFFNNDDTIINRQINISKMVNLYIAETSAGTTTPIIYYFYLIGTNEDAKRFITKDSDRKKTFLSTTDGNVAVDVINTDVYLRVSGDIYQFSNRGIFKYNDNLYGVRVFLESTPE